MFHPYRCSNTIAEAGTQKDYAGQKSKRHTSVWQTFTLLCVSVILIVGLSAHTALADEATANEDTLTEATPFSTLSYQLLHVDGQSLGMEDFWAGLLIGSIPEDTTLPALIEIAVPEGTLVGWFGQLPDREIFEGAIQFPEPYQVRTENGMDIYSAVLTNFHHAQLEFRYDANPLVESTAENMSIYLSYTPIQDLDELILTATFPAGFAASDPELSFRGAGPDGEQTFARSFDYISAGEQVSTTITGFYVGEGAVESSTDTLVVIMIAAASVFAIALVFFFFVRGKNSPEEE